MKTTLRNRAKYKPETRQQRALKSAKRTKA
jgi:hypothetical protein